LPSKNSEVDMRTNLVVSLLIALCILIGVGPAAASNVTYPDGSVSQVFNLGNGAHAFVFFDNAGDNDIFIHAVDFFADLFRVTLNGIPGDALWLDFEGFTGGGLMQYGVYSCLTSSFVSCSSFGNRRGTLFL
jgi:hypothetical protein